VVYYAKFCTISSTFTFQFQANRNKNKLLFWNELQIKKKQNNELYITEWKIWRTKENHIFYYIINSKLFDDTVYSARMCVCAIMWRTSPFSIVIYNIQHLTSQIVVCFACTTILCRSYLYNIYQVYLCFDILYVLVTK
jgi:hypothetical protein